MNKYNREEKERFENQNFNVDERVLCVYCRRECRPKNGIVCMTLNNEPVCDNCVDDMAL